jgi:hypothetical protein
VSDPKQSFPWKWLSFDANIIEPRPSWRFDFSGGSWIEARVTMPHWFLLLVASSIAILPWVGWSTSFSLRTLLIATTLVAVVLGFVVYAIGQ